MMERKVCLTCGDTYRPNSAKQTHYCSAQCGDVARNRKKRDRRLALERNIKILHTYKIPAGHARHISIDALKQQGFNFDAHSYRMNIPLSDGITFSSKLCFGPYLLYNEENKTYVKYF
jgi:predicted RNA-binding Zn-ribbon protein involved in translation (DUF1610 family)